jgi:hypothetical protein
MSVHVSSPWDMRRVARNPVICFGGEQSQYFGNPAGRKVEEEGFHNAARRFRIRWHREWRNLWYCCSLLVSWDPSRWGRRSDVGSKFGMDLVAKTHAAVDCRKIYTN